MEPATAHDPGGRSLVEGFAHVVEANDATALLEPEPASSCGGCASAGMCGTNGGKRLAARRFTIANTADLRPGERVVIGVPEDTLLRASMTAYVLPLVALLLGAAAVNLTGGGDGATAVGAFGGLALGLLVARWRAGRLAARGELSPRYIRHARLGEDCHTTE